MPKRADPPDVRAVKMIRSWGQQMGLAPDNLWEPAIFRNIEREAQALGNDANAWAFVEAKYKIQLGVK